MKEMKIYLAGGMQNLAFNEQYGWRDKFAGHLDDYNDNFLNGEYNLTIINPVDYYNFEEVTYKSMKEVMNFDLNLVRKSDLIIVSFNDPNSIGTAMELAIAYEKRIPIIGLCVEVDKFTNLSLSVEVKRQQHSSRTQRCV